MQAGGENSRSMALDCLEDLANLREQGMDEEVVRNVTGSVYMGKPILSRRRLNLNLTSVCSND